MLFGMTGCIAWKSLLFASQWIFMLSVSEGLMVDCPLLIDARLDYRQALPKSWQSGPSGEQLDIPCSCLRYGIEYDSITESLELLTDIQEKVYVSRVVKRTGHSKNFAHWLCLAVFCSVDVMAYFVHITWVTSLVLGQYQIWKQPEKYGWVNDKNHWQLII